VDNISVFDDLSELSDYDRLISGHQGDISVSGRARLKVPSCGASAWIISTQAAGAAWPWSPPMSTSLAVAELTFGLMLALAREIPRADVTMKRGEWKKRELEGVELNGKTLGLIGFGRIGVEVGRRAQVFGMTVVAYDPLIEAQEIKRRGAEPIALWLYACSILFPATFGVQARLLSALAFPQMKSGVRIIMRRQHHRWQPDCRLNMEKVAGAALDVFAQEPPGKSEAVMHPRVIATPHVGAQTVEAQSRAGDDIAAEVLNALQNKPLRWKVS
jgi:D-3-phosphoglycerate dehydrogenase